MKRYNRNNLFLTAFLALGITAPQVMADATAQQPARRVTIWVHGTRVGSFMPLGIISTLAGLEHRVLYAPPGLHTPDEINPELYHHKIPGFISAADPARFPLEDFYVYGWSGDLDFNARIKAGAILAKELKELVAYYIDQDGAAPEITFITHSHGGNVVLEMTKSISLKDLGDVPVTALFLACPVQQATEKLIANPLFKHIYNIHSHDDIVQISDPQAFGFISDNVRAAYNTGSFDPLTGIIEGVGDRISGAWDKLKKFENPFAGVEIFSGREFKPQSNLKQARVSWIGLAPWTSQDFAVLGKYKDDVESIKNSLQKLLAIKNRGLVHMEFMFPLFFSRLPQTLKMTDDLWTKRSKQEKDPDVVIKLQGK